MDILGFLAAVIPLTLSPGASFTLAMNTAADTGMRGVVRIIVGTVLGILTHGLLGGIGIAGLLARYPALLHTLTLCGTVYLLYLALRLIGQGWCAASTRSLSQHTLGLRTAYLANILNIKAVLFYVSVVPLFAGITQRSLPWGQGLSHFLLLAALHGVILALWLLFAAQLLIRSQGGLNPLRLKRGINLAGGTWLLGLTLWSLLK